MRLAEALLLLYHTFRKADDTEPFAIGISREDQASMAGTAKETAIRLLSEFKEEGIIATRGSQVTILKVAGAEPASGFGLAGTVKMASRLFRYLIRVAGHKEQDAIQLLDE